MTTRSSLTRRLERLREKKARLERRISTLTEKLARAGGPQNWGNCSCRKNRVMS